MQCTPTIEVFTATADVLNFLLLPSQSTVHSTIQYSNQRCLFEYSVAFTTDIDSIYFVSSSKVRTNN